MKMKKTVALIAAMSIIASSIPTIAVSAVDSGTTTSTAAATAKKEVDYSGAQTVKYNMTAPYEGIVSTLSFEFTDVAISEDAKTLSIGLGTMNFPDLKDIIGNNYSLSNRERSNIDVLYDIQEVTVTVGSDKYVVSNDTSSEDFNRVFSDDYSNLSSVTELTRQWSNLDDAYISGISLTNFRDALKRNDKDAGYYTPVKISVEVKIAAKAIGSYANKYVIGDYRDAMMAYAENNVASLDNRAGTLKNGKAASTEVETTFEKTMRTAITKQPNIYGDKEAIAAYATEDLSKWTVEVDAGEYAKQKDEAVKLFKSKFADKFGDTAWYETPNFTSDCVEPGGVITKPSEPDPEVVEVIKATAGGTLSMPTSADEVAIRGSITTDGTTPISNVSTAVTTQSGVTIVKVVLPQGTVGSSQEGIATKQKNYHIEIPIADLDAGWTFAKESKYQFDNDTHPEWNIDTTGKKLKLWLNSDAAKNVPVVLKNTDGAKAYIVINTAVGASSVNVEVPAVEESITTKYAGIFDKITDYSLLCAELKKAGFTKNGDYKFTYNGTKWEYTASGAILSTTDAPTLTNRLNSADPNENDTVTLHVGGIETVKATNEASTYTLNIEKFIEAQQWYVIAKSETDTKINDDNGKIVTYSTYSNTNKAYTNFTTILTDMKKLEDNVADLQKKLADGAKKATAGDSWDESKALIKEKTSSGTTSLPRPETIRSREWYQLAGAYDYRSSQYYLAEIVDTIGDAKGAKVSFHIVPSSFKKNDGVAPTISSYDAARYLTSGAQGSTLLRVNSVSTNQFMNLITYDYATSTLSFDWDTVTNARFSDNILYVRTLDLLATATFDIDEIEITIPNQEQFKAAADADKDKDDLDGDTDEIKDDTIGAGESDEPNQEDIKRPGEDDEDNGTADDPFKDDDSDWDNVDLGNEDDVKPVDTTPVDNTPVTPVTPVDTVPVTPVVTTTNNTPSTGNTLPVMAGGTSLVGLLAAVLLGKKKNK